MNEDNEVDDLLLEKKDLRSPAPLFSAVLDDDEVLEVCRLGAS